MFLNKLLLLCLILFISYCNGSAQEFYAVTSSNQLILVDMGDNCSQVNLGTMNLPAGTFFFDVAGHPDGNLYGVTGGGDLYLIDPNTAAIMFLGNLGAFPNALVGAADGTLYGADFNGQIWAIDVDNATATFLGNCGYQSAGDLTFIDGEMYLVTFANEIVLIDINNPPNSMVVLTLPNSSSIFGIVTFATSCDDFVSYATSADPNSEIYQFNLQGDFSLECTLLGNATGAAALNEFIASDCDLSIDLDDDDSSGADGPDFNAPELCLEFSSNIADFDVLIESDNPVDTIIVWISSGNIDDPNEILNVSASGVINVEGDGSQFILLINNGGADLVDFQDILLDLTYENTAADPTPGTREISVIAFSDGQQSDTAIAFITIVEMPEAGDDNEVTLCNSDDPIDLFSLLGPDADSNGVWMPMLSGGGNIFVPGLDIPGAYAYVVPGQADCQEDMAVVTVNIEVPPFAGDDVDLVFCESDDPIDLFTLIPNDPNAGGNIEPALISGGTIFDPALDLAGTYFYIVQSTGICPSDTAVINVTLEQPVFAGSDVELEVCEFDAPFDLLDFMPDAPPNGEFSPPLESGGTIFDPAVDLAVFYTYFVDGGLACQEDDAFVEVTVITALSAGDDVDISVCNEDDEIDLLLLINPEDFSGTIQPDLFGGGTTFNPAVDTSGTYFYLIQGLAPCEGDTAIIEIEVQESIQLGIDTSIVLCDQGSVVDLNDVSQIVDLSGIWSPPLSSGGSILDPALDGSGTYAYVVDDANLCDPDTVFVVVDIVPSFNAGDPTDIMICRNGDPINVFNLINGNPDIGGSISPPFVSGTYLFNPQLDGAGNYQYLFPSENGCVGDTTIINISIEIPPVAGIDTTLSVCEISSPVDLSQFVEPGGIWSPTTATTGIFDPALDGEGMYHYIVSGDLCADDTATLNIVVTSNSNAGGDAFAAFCSTSLPFDIRTIIADNPDTSGRIEPALNSGNFIFNPAIDVAGTYLYIVDGLPPCQADTSIISITIFQPPNAGIDNAVELCSSDMPINMLSLISPSDAGIWIPETALSDVFDPAVDMPGFYLYVVDGGICDSDTSVLQINVTQPPNAGVNTAIEICPLRSPFPIWELIDGGPDGSGRVVPSLSSGTAVFDPSVDLPGSYTYIVDGIDPCPSDTSNLDLTFRLSVNAGDDVSLRICSDNGPLDLFDLISGNPDGGGTWLPALNSGNNLFDPQIDGTNVYAYILGANDSCGTDTAFVDVLIDELQLAGRDTAYDLCSGDEILLWTDIFGPSASLSGMLEPSTMNPQFFDPGIDPGGVYRYVTGADDACGRDTAFFTFSIEEEIILKEDTTLNLCESQSNIVDLSQFIGADVPGFWEPTLSVPGQFNPAVDVPGMYGFTLFDATCVNRSQVFILVDVVESVDAGEDGLLGLCEDDEIVNLEVLLSASADPGGSWLPSDRFNPQFDEDGTFLYVVEGPCDTDTAQFDLTVYRLPQVDLGPSREICPGDTIALNLTEFRDVTYEWSDGTVGPDLLVSNPGQYQVTISNERCMETEFVIITEADGCFDCPVYVPNAFSPNDDGINDVFTSFHDCQFSAYKLQVFNRWGGLVFESNDPDRGWDGNMNEQRVDEAVFVYVLEYQIANDPSGEIFQKVGDVAVIR